MGSDNMLLLDQEISGTLDVLHDTLEEREDVDEEPVRDEEEILTFLFKEEDQVEEDGFEDDQTEASVGVESEYDEDERIEDAIDEIKWDHLEEIENCPG